MPMAAILSGLADKGRGGNLEGSHVALATVLDMFCVVKVVDEGGRSEAAAGQIFER